MNLTALFAAAALALAATVAVAEPTKKPDQAGTTAETKADSTDKKAAQPEQKAEAKTEATAADEKPTLKADADPEVKKLIEEAKTANDAAKAAQFEWYWANYTASEHLDKAIKAANEGNKEEAMKIAKLVKIAGEQGQKQAEAAKTVKPRI